MNKKKIGKHADHMGIFASAVCAVHCLLTPVVAIFSPPLVAFFESSLIHLIIFIVAIPLALYAFITNRRKHGANGPFILGTVGVIFLSVGLFWGYIEHGLGPHSHYFLSEDVIFSIIGGVFLMAGHVYNMKLCHCHHDCLVENI